MIKRKQIICVVMALLVLSFSYPLSVPAKAIAIDPVTFMYPIWQMMGQAGGVTITTVGGDEFTQNNFPSLFDEWQQSRVSSGLQQAAQSISDWASEMWDYVKVAPSAVSAGILSTALRLESYVVLPLQQFWNWIITDKLGGSAVDAIDFNTQLASASAFPRVPYGLGELTNSNKELWWAASLHVGGNTQNRNFGVGLASADNPNCFVFYRVASNYYYVTVCSTSSFSMSYVANDNGSYGTPVHFNSREDHGYYSRDPIQVLPSRVVPGIPVYESAEAGKQAFLEFAQGGYTGGGSITIAPDAGLQELSFPDTDDPAYVPGDVVLPWNVPYDQTKDTAGYLEEAYDKAMDNTLTDQVITQNPPVEGTGTVGNVGEYVAPGLAEVFPFCIPFDVYNFLEALAADPQAPSFTAQLAFPDAVGGTRSITIDFDTPEWNAVAQILRTLELLLFIIGLAVVTREKFIRS